MDRRVVWFFLNLFSFTTAYAAPDHSQVGALIAFKNALYDPTRRVFKYWYDGDTSPCTWFHITCDDNGGVIRILLGNAGLSGTLASDLQYLKTLQELEMYNNNISGHIPWEVERLPNLVSLDLYNNKLTGPIPWGLGNAKSLKFVRLYNNNLCGLKNTRLLNKINRRGVADTSNNPRLCDSPTDPRCSKKIKCS